MAEIYTKVSKKTAILSPRELVIRPFNFSDWEEIRLGIYFSVTTAVSNNANSVNETVALSTSADRIMFGIKDDSDNIPGAAGSSFIGIGTHSGESSICVANQGGGFCQLGGSVTANSGMCGLTCVGATITENAAVGNTALKSYSASSGASNYGGFACLRIVVNDRGLSTQSVSLNWYSIETGNTTLGNLLADMNNMTGTQVSLGADLDWNDGASARALPNNFYLRLPFYNNRIRLGAMQAIRYS